jgi:hypothetical protein
MKKILVLSIFLMGATFIMKAEGRPIEVNELPEKARVFIADNFKGLSIALAKKDVDGLIFVDYDVFFTDGTKIVFGKDGSWEEVECKQGEVPASIVPVEISSYVKRILPKEHIVSIEKDRVGYEIKLSNRIEIKFSNDFKVLDYDD